MRSNRIVRFSTLAAAIAMAAFTSMQAPAQSSPNGQSGNTRGANSPTIGGVGKYALPRNPTPKPAPRTADGKPDLSGVWGGPVGGLQHIGRELPGTQLPYTPAGQQAYQYNLTKEVDPSALCILQGVPRADLSGQPFEIVQNSKRVAFLYERDTSWRIVAADGRQHPADPEPSYYGNAIGNWDGDAFVVDSVAFKGTHIWGDETAHPQSDALHLVERWTRPDLDHLLVEVTIDDPKYYTKPFKFNRSFRLLPYDLIEQPCDENNIDRSHIGVGLGTKDGTRGYTKKHATQDAQNSGNQ
ncbi:MAG: hypothetical protein ABSA57_06610 [Candidatus Acidiferrales bacterium]